MKKSQKNRENSNPENKSGKSGEGTGDKSVHNISEDKRGRRGRKALKWIAGIFVIAFLLLFAAEWFLEGKLRSLIEDRNIEIDGRTYAPRVGKVRLNLLTRSVMLRELELREVLPADLSANTAAVPAYPAFPGADSTAVYVKDENGLRFNGSGADVPPVSASVREITVKGIGFKKKDGKYRVRVRDILIASPYGFLETGKSGGKTAVVKKRSRQELLAEELRREGRQKDSLLRAAKGKNDKKISDLLDRLEIGNLAIENGNIRYSGWKEGEKSTYSLTGFYFKGDSLLILGNSPLWGKDSAAVRTERLAKRSGEQRPGTIRPGVSGKRKELFTARDLTCSFNKFRSRYHYGAMVLEADSLRIGWKDSLFSVSAVRLLPQYGEYVYAKKVKDHTDWTRVVVGPVRATGIDFRRFLSENVLYMDTLSVSSADVRSYKNRQVYQEPKIKPLSWISLHHLPFKISVPTVVLRRIDVTYEELSAKGLHPGKITITGIEGLAEGLTNIPSGNGKKTYYRLDASGYLMGEGHLKAHFKLPVDSLNTHFEVRGGLGPMNLTALNGMILPLANLKVKSGRCNGVDFAVSANSVKSHVNMTFLYDDLKVELFKEKRGGLVKRGFLSGVVNLIGVHTRNPNGRRIRTGEGSFERDPYKSQFNYLWKSLFPGIKDTVLAI